jgi:hypothetical protein
MFEVFIHDEYRTNDSALLVCVLLFFNLLVCRTYLAKVLHRFVCDVQSDLREHLWLIISVFALFLGRNQCS